MAKAKSIILILIGVAAILFMVHLAGAADVINVLSQSDPLFVLAAISVEFFAIFLWAIRWKILLNPFAPIPLQSSFNGILIGLFFNNITPIARAGGEPFRAYYLNKKEDIDVEDAFATVAIDRILDSIPFQVFIILSLAYFIFFLKISGNIVFVLILFFILNLFLLFLVFYFSLNIKAAKKLMASIFKCVARLSTSVRKYEDRVEKAVEHYHTSIMTFSSQGGTLAVSLAFSFFLWFFVILRAYLVVIALGYQVSFMTVLIVQTIGTLVGILPLLPGGLGSVDGIMAFLYLSFDFPPAAAVSASLLDRFISFWIISAVGGICIFMERTFLNNDL